MLFTFAKLFNQVSRRDDNARLGIGEKVFVSKWTRQRPQIILAWLMVSKNIVRFHRRKFDEISINLVSNHVSSWGIIRILKFMINFKIL